MNKKNQLLVETILRHTISDNQDTIQLLRFQQVAPVMRSNGSNTRLNLALARVATRVS